MSIHPLSIPLIPEQGSKGVPEPIPAGIGQEVIMHRSPEQVTNPSQDTHHSLTHSHLGAI
uniref:Uncharacterized protein n=1 Tax=Anguilla anguilla TaxID=7936 RepID=A0A0E9UL67_ANGAN